MPVAGVGLSVDLWVVFVIWCPSAFSEVLWGSGGGIEESVVNSVKRGLIPSHSNEVFKSL
jgi:hypothetical protein